jgi:hypothetical protein
MALRVTSLNENGAIHSLCMAAIDFIAYETGESGSAYAVTMKLVPEKIDIVKQH